MDNFLDRTYFGNTVALYLTAVGVFIVSLAVIYIFKAIILSRLKKWSEKTTTTIDDFLVKSLEKTIVPLLYFGAFYLAVNTLNFPHKIEKIINTGSIIIATLYGLKVITSALHFIINAFLKRRGESETRQKEIRGITTLLNILIWVLGLVFLLDNLGFDVSAVIAGLGIGGGSAYLMEYLSKSFRKPADLESFFELPVLVSIPTIYDSRQLILRKLNLVCSAVVSFTAMGLLGFFTAMCAAGPDQVIGILRRIM